MDSKTEQRDSLERPSLDGPPSTLPPGPSGAALQEGPTPVTIPSAGQSHGQVSEGTPQSVDNVLKSDIGISTLLTRLKQSIASAREFASFLKKRSTLEEEQAQGLKKLCRSGHDAAPRAENRQGSYVQNYHEVLRIHDRMADNGIQFALSLHQMHEDLQELAANMERGRKQWKQTGLNAEKRVQDSEAMMEKAKSKYHSLAEDYDRARTGDKQAGRVFGLKGPKSAAQVEEDLQRKVQQADADYQTRVQTAKSQRQELMTTLRPQAIQAMRDLIFECDFGLTLQLQKFASFNERLLLGNGLCVSPLRGQASDPTTKSLRDVILRIDNNADFNHYVASHASRAPAAPQIEYKPHPTLAPQQHAPTQAARTQPLPSVPPPQQQQQQQQQPPLPNPQGPPQLGPPTITPSGGFQQQKSGPPAGFAPPSTQPTSFNTSDPPQREVFQSSVASSAPQLPPAQASAPLYTAPPAPLYAHANNSSHSSLPALRPVFGLSLEDLLKRDGSAIPLVVYQCIQAVDLYGLEVEGIYRLSGSANHVSKLKAQFDHDSTQLDFRNPESFFHDVNSVVGLLKQFFRDLPDPLMTQEHYQGFIDAARIDDDITRRDSIHATINSLPDPNYATLRALTLHLHRVQERNTTNRMTAGNLAIIFGPTLMGTGPNVADAGWQVRVIDTILQNTLQIFDED